MAFFYGNQIGGWSGTQMDLILLIICYPPFVRLYHEELLVFMIMMQMDGMYVTFYPIYVCRYDPYLGLCKIASA